MSCKNIVLGRLSDNAIGQIRSLGEAGMNPIVIWIGKQIPNTIKFSRWTKEIFLFENVSNAIDWLIDNYKNEKEKPVITIDTDNLVAEMNDNYERLAPFFHFFNAGLEGRLSYWMKKERLCELAKDCGLKIPYTRVYDLNNRNETLAWGGNSRFLLRRQTLFLQIGNHS